MNVRCIEHTYSISDRVMVLVEYDPTKLDAKKKGTFTIVRVFVNATVRLQNVPNLQETFNSFGGVGSYHQ